MNILFVNDSPFNPIIGGLERVTDVLTKELQMLGYGVYYLCGKINPLNNSMLDYAFPAPLYLLPNYGLFEDAANCSYYRELIIELQIDVVINQRGLRGWFNGLLNHTNTKLISVIHSTPDSYIRVSVAQLKEVTRPPFKYIKKIFKKIFPRTISLYKKMQTEEYLKEQYTELAKGSDAIVVLSNEDIHVLNKFIQTPINVQLVSIPNPNTFGVTKHPLIIHKKKIVLYVGRLERVEKNPMRLLKVWEIIHKKHSEWQLQIVGDGSEKSRMQSYVKEHGLNSVSFKGRQSNVSKYYAEASFICLTSNFEGWGMTLTEGMQYGCIPFTFDNYGAASEIIDNGLNGCLIHSFDIKQYAERLSMLMSDDRSRTEMSLAAIEKVKEFSVENVVMRWDKLFQSLYDHP